MALVTGSHGLSGRAVYEHLHGRPGWKVIGASRRAEAPVAGAPHIAVDLADRVAARDALARSGWHRNIPFPPDCGTAWTG